MFFLAKIELLSKLLFLTINDATNGQIVAWQVVVLIYFCPHEKYTFYSMSDYRFEQLDLSENGIRRTSDLLSLVFGESAKLTPEYIHWEYNQNPAGKALGFDAWMEDVQAAHYVTQPLISEIEGKKVKGLLSLNTATHPDHRGKKLFSVLAEKTYEGALKQGYEFVIGVANANSTPGFLKNLGFALIKPLDVKVGIGNLNYNFEAGYDYARIWDKEQLEWRLNNPKLTYQITKVKGGFIILAPTGNKGIRAVMGYFPESLYSDNFKNKAITTVNPAKIWMGIDNKLSWKGKLYFNFPEKLKISPLNLIFRDLTGKNRLPEPGSLRFMNIDFDAY